MSRTLEPTLRRRLRIEPASAAARAILASLSLAVCGTAMATVNLVPSVLGPH